MSPEMVDVIVLRLFVNGTVGVTLRPVPSLHVGRTPPHGHVVSMKTSPIHSLSTTE